MTQHSALQGFSTRKTPQSEPIPGSDQVENSAGGFAWEVDCWTRLRRFLILGTEGGTYYIGQPKLTRENAEAVMECIKEDGARTVREIVTVSTKGSAPKNDPAIFALAMCSKLGDELTRKEANDAVADVCRIGTHLFHFATYVEQFGGWSRGTRRAVARWYERDVDKVAYQAVKYRQRDGWTHRDLLRLSHPKAPTPEHRVLYDFICERASDEPEPSLLEAYRGAQGENPDLPWLIREFNLPREALPTEALNDPKVWEALLEDMPMTALIRNLATMTRVGLLGPTSVKTAKVIAQLGDEERIRKARVHPIQALAAMLTYSAGRGARGQNTWTPIPQIVDALDAAFYTAFGNVESSGKRTLLALDVSSSMTWNDVAGVPGLSPRVASAAMALVTANKEVYECMGFARGGFIPIALSPRQRLDDVCKMVSGLPFGGTDCALPMLYAQQYDREFDSFVVYTDSETWAGNIHPTQALQEYRQKTGIPARLAVVGMVSNGFSIADPNDPGMLDVVGFDTAAPNLMADFFAGRV